MNTFRRFALVVCALALSTACTRKTEDKTAVSLSLPMTGSVLGKPGVAQSLSSQNTLLGSLDQIVLNVSGGPDGLIVCSIDVDRNQVEGPCSITVSGTTAALSLDIKPGSGQLIQAVLAYESETSSALYYGSSRVSISGSNANVSLGVSNIGSGVISAGVEGRYLRTPGDPGMTGQLNLKFRPNASDPPMTIKRSTMVAGWFSTMVLGDFDNRLEVNGETLFGGPVGVGYFVGATGTGANGYEEAEWVGAPRGRFVADGADRYEILGFHGPGRVGESVPRRSIGSCGGPEFTTCLQLRDNASIRQSSFLGPFQRFNGTSEDMVSYSSGTLSWVPLPQVTAGLVQAWHVYEYDNLSVSKITQASLGDGEWDCKFLDSQVGVVGSGVTLKGTVAFGGSSVTVGSTSANRAWFVCPRMPSGEFLNTAVVYPKAWDVSDPDRAPYLRWERVSGPMPNKFARHLCYSMRIRAYQNGQPYTVEVADSIIYDSTVMQIYSNVSNCTSNTALLPNVPFPASQNQVDVAVRFIGVASEVSSGMDVTASELIDVEALNTPFPLYTAQVRPRMPSAWVADSCYSVYYELVDDEGRLASVDQSIDLSLSSPNNLSNPFRSSMDCSGTATASATASIGAGSSVSSVAMMETKSAPFAPAPSLVASFIAGSTGLAGLVTIGAIPTVTLASGTSVVDSVQVVVPSVGLVGECVQGLVRFVNAAGSPVPLRNEMSSLNRIRLRVEGPANGRAYLTPSCVGAAANELTASWGQAEVPFYYSASNLGLGTVRAQITGSQVGLQAQGSTVFFGGLTRPYVAANIQRLPSSVRVIGSHEFPLTAPLVFGNATGLECVEVGPFSACPSSVFNRSTLQLSFSAADWSANKTYEVRVWNRDSGQTSILRINRESFLSFSAPSGGMNLPELVSCTQPTSAGLAAGTYTHMDFLTDGSYCLQPGANVSLSNAIIYLNANGDMIVGHSSGVNTMSLAGTSRVEVNSISTGLAGLANLTINSASTRSDDSVFVNGVTGTGRVVLSNLTVNSTSTSNQSVIVVRDATGTSVDINHLVFNLNAAGPANALRIGNISNFLIVNLKVTDTGAGAAEGIRYDASTFPASGPQSNNKVYDYVYSGQSSAVHMYHSLGGSSFPMYLEGHNWEAQTTSATVSSVLVNRYANLKIFRSQIRQIGAVPVLQLNLLATDMNDIDVRESVLIHQNPGSSALINVAEGTGGMSDVRFSGNHFVRLGASANADLINLTSGTMNVNFNNPYSLPAKNTNLLCSDSSNRFSTVFSVTPDAGNLNSQPMSVTDPNMAGVGAVSATTNRCIFPNP